MPLIRTVLRSRTYQLSARTNALNADDSLYFSHALTKLQPAEVLLDAISTLTGTATVTSTLLSDFNKHLLYVNVHTTKNPEGEIRGQLARG